MATLNLEVDGKPVQVQSGATVDGTRLINSGCMSPHFCLAQGRLTIAANCRMCLVQVEEKRPSPLPAMRGRRRRKA